MDYNVLNDKFKEKIEKLKRIAWDNKVEWPQVLKWLENFKNQKEKVHALFLLSQFMYFGSDQIRYLLKCLYRDLYKYKIIEKIRKKNHDAKDIKLINNQFEQFQRKTRFLGVGNPSESGVHLLYFFRQENKLAKNLFIHGHEIFKRDGGSGAVELKNNKIDHYVFIDDFCGSGSQAISYSENLVQDIKQLNPKVQVDYLMLFATQIGKNNIKQYANFDFVESVFELDDSFRCFSNNSRYFTNSEQGIDRNYSKKFCEKYGYNLMYNIMQLEGYEDKTKLDDLAKQHALGFGDGQLLIGFHHNIPDNTLPIIWYDEEEIRWTPIFKRYNKKYSD